ncbi:DUF1826 domain-containing protein [Zobellella aerophila]|uniref:DUF1826 domain-containing protein n=1 Tax=Zobellella aerophila TaxID=870480 RepID=A0ABP6W5J6_9GAMM
MNITEQSLSCSAPVSVQGGEPATLTRIYDPGCNLAVWRRTLPVEVAAYVQKLMQLDRRVSVRGLLTPETVMDELHARLPDLPGREALAADIRLLVEMFACLFGLSRVGVRLASLQTAMCPRFHVDRVPCRLVTTYSGPGTHWLNQQQRDQLLEQQGKEPERWQQLAVGEVALLKGEAWEDNDGEGLWHRSPPVPTGYGRLFLSLDVAD